VQGQYEIYISIDDFTVAEASVNWTLVASGEWEFSWLEKQAFWLARPARRIRLKVLSPAAGVAVDTNSANAAAAGEVNVLGSYKVCEGAGAGFALLA
jgi:hypothetical protein